MQEKEKEIDDEKKRLIKERDNQYLDVHTKLNYEKVQIKGQRQPSISLDIKRQGSYIISGGDETLKNRNYSKEIEYEQGKYINDTEIINMVYNNRNKQAKDLYEILQIEKHETLLNNEKEKTKNLNEKKNNEENKEFNINHSKDKYDDISFHI